MERGTRMEGVGYANEQMEGRIGVYGDKFEAVKVKNEQPKICEIATQFAVDARNSYGWLFFFQHGHHAERQAETIITHSHTSRTRRFSLHPHCSLTG